MPQPLSHRERVLNQNPATAPGPRFICSEVYRTAPQGPRHPLAIPRVSLAMDLCRALGWLDDANFIESPRATKTELARFHDPAYVAAVEAAELTGSAPDDVKQRYHLGINGNPLFDGMFRRPATACGAGMLAARMLMSGTVDTVYSPGGGQHHAFPDRANGFCYFNEPVLTILSLLDHGAKRVFYLDLDAHHGDGVQAAFAEDERVMTVSFHEAGRWPMERGVNGMNDGDGLGGVQDRAGGTARNLPVPAEFNDLELAYLMENAILPLADHFNADAIYVQAGCDALADDPQSKLSLSNGALWQAIAMMRSAAPKLMVTGGGGYNPYAVGRCWAGIWAALNGYAVPAKLPEEAEAPLRNVTWHHRLGRDVPNHWLTTLADPSNTGPVRPVIKDLARRTLEF